MTVIYLLLFWFGKLQFSWFIFLIAVAIDSAAAGARKRALENKIESGEAEESEIEEYLGEHNGDEELVNENYTDKDED